MITNAGGRSNPGRIKFSERTRPDSQLQALLSARGPTPWRLPCSARVWQPTYEPVPHRQGQTQPVPSLRVSFEGCTPQALPCKQQRKSEPSCKKVPEKSRFAQKITGRDQEQKQGDNRRKTEQNRKSPCVGAAEIASVLIPPTGSGPYPRSHPNKNPARCSGRGANTIIQDELL